MKILISLLLLISSSAFALTGTVYNPTSVDAFDKTKLNYNGLKVSASVAAGATTDVNLALTDDHLLTGAQLILTGACDLDEVQFKIVDSSSSIPVPARVAFPNYPILNQFIDWYASNFSKDLPYPAKITAGLTLRVTYKNTCVSTAVTVKVNYFLHKIIVQN